jgi:hypothetical protein
MFELIREEFAISKFSLGCMLVALILVAAASLSQKHDLHENYTPVTAHVSSVQESCRLSRQASLQERAIYGRSRYDTITSDELDCAEAERRTKTDPQWRGAFVNYAITLAYDYISPVDGRKYAGSEFISRYPDGRKLRPDDAFNVMASKINAEISTTALPASPIRLTQNFQAVDERTNAVRD